MSYCRWSSMNGYCDVYVYDDVSGAWMIHVASCRRPDGAPPDPLGTFRSGGGSEEYRRRRKAWDLWADQNPPTPIEHPEAGTSHDFDTPGECADKLEELRREGFVVPQYAIDALREEASE